MDKAHKVLKNIFGYDSFRPLQQGIIESVLAKQDSLVIMPTGGGKSLCYQIPALLFDGLTVVISPLISLMKDQVGQLRQNGVDVAILNSSLTRPEFQENYNLVVNKKAKLLYLAPESLNRPDIAGLLFETNVDCLTVDEAHCISEWGHDFRPDYRQLGLLRKKLPNAVCIGLTATATPRVQDDIVKNLNMSAGRRFLAGFNRENLHLQVIPKSDPLDQTIKFLRERKDQPGIIYCFSRKQVDRLSADLNYYGFSAKPYHAGLEDKERHKNQDLFSRDEVQIIVATIAFGMGINKSNVRFVIHYDLPKNLESYYQEIGRAGRDGLRADCLLLYSYSDVNKLNYFIDQKEDENERLAAIRHLDDMVRYAEWNFCRRIPLITYFGEKYEEQFCGACDNCLADKGELTDITIAAQKFLSTVKRTGERFGVLYLADVLRGTPDSKIIMNGHDKLSVFGVGKEYSKKEWQFLGQQFINKGLVVRDLTHGGINLTAKASDVLFKNEKVTGYLTVSKLVSETVQAETDQKLIQRLKDKRKEIAQSSGVPPFVVFSDNTLHLMALRQPTTITALAEISGVGTVKLKKYGADFIGVIKEFVVEHGAGKAAAKKHDKVIKSDSRSVIVAEMFNSGKTVLELANHFAVKEDTIFNHLYKYLLSGKSLRKDGLAQINTTPKGITENVFEFFRKEGPGLLTPVYKHFEEQISYDDLRLLRLIFLTDNPEFITSAPDKTQNQ